MKLTIMQAFSSQIREIASEQVEKLVERNTPAPVQTDVQAEDSSDTTQDAAVTDQIYTIFCQWYRYTGRYYSFKSK